MVSHKSSEQAAITAAPSADHVADAGDRGLANPHHTRAALQSDSYTGREAVVRSATDSTAGAALQPMQISESTLSPKKSLDDLSKAGVVPTRPRPVEAMLDTSKPEPRPITSFEKQKSK
ncbi:MAG: hypothetical protein IPL73_10005 [Candidatus Obscuribacter sp.]|nr:hypothetical protein [Candidatus Obscuribacter sp.]